MHHIPHEICSVSAAKRARIEPTWASWNLKKSKILIFLPLPLFFTFFAIYHHFGWCNLFLKNLLHLHSPIWWVDAKAVPVHTRTAIIPLFCWHLMSATNTPHTRNQKNIFFDKIINTLFVANAYFICETSCLTQIRMHGLTLLLAIITSIVAEKWLKTKIAQNTAVYIVIVNDRRLPDKQHH